MLKMLFYYDNIQINKNIVKNKILSIQIKGVIKDNLYTNSYFIRRK